MKVILFGASGMVGQGVLRECLLDEGVTAVLSLVRRPEAPAHPKLREQVCTDFFDYTALEPLLVGYDACFFCLGVSSGGLSEAEYRRLSYDLTLAAATTLARLNPPMVFVYVSGMGTDSSERGRSMWARVKGATENALRRLPFAAVYLFRPGGIRPLHGIRSKTPAYRWGYALMGPLVPLLHRFAPGAMTSTEEVGRAMLRVVRERPARAILEARDIAALGRGEPLPAARS